MSKVTRRAVPYKKAAKEKKFYICVDCFVEKDSGGYMIPREEYFEDVEELVDFCKDCDYDIPQLVYGTDERAIHIDMMQALENACEDHYYEFESYEASEIEELQGIVDTWVEKSSRKYYTKDPTYIIDIWDEVKELSK